MPNRLLNLVSFAMFPLVLGMLYARREDLLQTLLLLIIILSSLFLSDVGGQYHLRKILFSAVLIAIFTSGFSRFKISRAYCPVLLALLSVVLFSRTMMPPFIAVRAHLTRTYELFPPLASVPQSGKYMITGPGISFAQYFTRRPQLISPGQLDYLSYSQGGWREVLDVLNDIYEVEYFSSGSHDGVLAQNAKRQTAFETRTREEWYQLGEKYNADLLTVEYRFKIDLPPLYYKPGFFIIYSLVRPTNPKPITHSNVTSRSAIFSTVSFDR